VAKRQAESDVRRRALIAAGLTLAFAVWLQRGIGGTWITTVVDDFGEAAAALVAAFACFRTGRRATGSAGRGWHLLGAAALAWGAGELWWSYLEAVLNRDVPFPSLADVGFLAVAPLAVAALLAWPGAFRRVTDRARAGLDGCVIALSLLFVSWAAVLGPMWRDPVEGRLGALISLAYPVSDVVIVTIALLTVRSAKPAARTSLLLVAAGLALVAVSDSAFAYLTSIGNYGSDLTGVGWFGGWLLVALAAVHPSAARPEVDGEEGPQQEESLVSLLLPYGPLAGAAGILFFDLATHRPLDPFLAGLGAVVGVLAMGRQLIALLDNRRLTARLQCALAALESREHQLEHQAFHDQLTGLANRALFWDRLEHALALAQRERRTFVVVYLDLDGFKQVNDRHGHLAGDRVLAAVAERLRGCVRPGDTLARLGGDEFGVLIEGVDEREPAEVGGRLLASLRHPFDVGSERITLGASIGVAVGTWTEADAAVCAADEAMYRAKAAGKGQVVVDTSSITLSLR
jgi:diguanylate cyclase (GGDEF)-like protein